MTGDVEFCLAIYYVVSSWLYYFFCAKIYANCFHESNGEQRTPCSFSLESDRLVKTIVFLLLDR